MRFFTKPYHMHSNITCTNISAINLHSESDCDFNIGAEANVWQISITAHILAVNDFVELLSADERARADRYYQQKDRERFIISRGALRILMSNYLKIPAAEVVFKIGINKKPFVESCNGTELHYNTSHSGDYILIIIASLPVGVDVESMEPLFPYQDILEYSFNPDEITYINQSEIPIETFYTLWTRKEALLKATAKGIDDDIKLVPCINGEHSVESSIIGSGQNWFVSSFNINDGYTGSIASLTKDIEFRVFAPMF